MANEKILIADDDKNICELLRLYLAKEGYETVIANDGEAAVAAFLENRIPFGAIANIVEQILASMPPARISCVEDVYRMDRGARSRANVEIGRME